VSSHKVLRRANQHSFLFFLASGLVAVRCVYVRDAAVKSAAMTHWPALADCASDPPVSCVNDVSSNTTSQ
jgi:hypothetical protein